MVQIPAPANLGAHTLSTATAAAAVAMTPATSPPSATAITGRKRKRAMGMQPAATAMMYTRAPKRQAVASVSHAGKEEDDDTVTGRPLLRGAFAAIAADRVGRVPDTLTAPSGEDDALEGCLEDGVCG